MNELIPNVETPVGEKGRFRVERKEVKTSSTQKMIYALKQESRYVPERQGGYY